MAAGLWGWLVWVKIIIALHTVMNINCHWAGQPAAKDANTTQFHVHRARTQIWLFADQLLRRQVKWYCSSVSESMAAASGFASTKIGLMSGSVDNASTGCGAPVIARMTLAGRGSTRIPGWNYILHGSGVNFEAADCPVGMVDSKNRQRTELTANKRTYGFARLSTSPANTFCQFAAPRPPEGPRRGLVGALVREGDCGGGTEFMPVGGATTFMSRARPSKRRPSTVLFSSPCGTVPQKAGRQSWIDGAAAGRSILPSEPEIKVLKSVYSLRNNFVKLETISPQKRSRHDGTGRHPAYGPRPTRKDGDGDHPYLLKRRSPTRPVGGRGVKTIAWTDEDRGPRW
ncbi:hypothetical protein B0H16DRAFT_1463288 [Mycena metata]|uniref:Uncharacterized protein n=1 Tax=Mycena metata TaxID=1033252 RepID=A0AAD7N3T8_9AGAR|nr:hypothetical protein B0H16DRAFT_1463288 [Mycena metata]